MHHPSPFPRSPVPPQNGETKTVSDYVEGYLGYNNDLRWVFTLTTFLFAIFFHLLATWALRKISYLKR